MSQKSPLLVGLSPRERAAFSITRLLASLSSIHDVNLRERAAYEFDVCRAAGQCVRGHNGVRIPFDVLMPMSTRDMTAGTSGQGQQLVGTMQPASFVEVLRPRVALTAAGATILPGLTGKLPIPKLVAGASGSWVGENTAPSETAYLATDSLLLSPKSCRAFVDISRTLLLLSMPAADLIVTNDLLAALANSLDFAGLHGPGGNSPAGVAGTSGIGLVLGGTNGAAPSFQNMLDLRAEVAIDNADFGQLAFISNASVQKKLSGTLKVTVSGSAFVVEDDKIIGVRTLWSNNVRADLVKGSSGAVCSAIFYGNWEDLVLALWGPGLDILVDPYTGSGAGTVRVVSFIDADVAVRRPQSFAVMLDALTS